MALGSSLGDRRGWLERAVHQLSARSGVQVVAVSRWWRSPPMRGGTARGWFLNGVVRLRTDLDPEALLALCVTLEDAAGRRRGRYWGDRTLDLDVLVHGPTVQRAPRLTLPHPGLDRRPFVLWPFLEVWPDAIDPRTGARWASAPPIAGPRCWPSGGMTWPRGAGTLGPPSTRRASEIAE